MTTTQQEQKQARHPMMAFAAGVFCPGLGLVLAGRFSYAAVAVFAWISVYLITPVVVIEKAPDMLPRLPSVVLAINALVWFGAAILAAVLAWRDGPRVRKNYEHPWWIIGYFVLVFGLFSQMRTAILSQQVVLEPIWDTSLRPTVKEGTLLVIVKRQFDAKQLKVNDVVAVPGQGKPISPHERYRGYARVIALPGSTVEVKEDGAVIVDGFPVINAACPATVPHDGHSCVWEKQATPAGAVERYTTATSFSRAFPPTSVGPSQVFVLPDDRGHKLDAPAGLIQHEHIEGVVVVSAQGQ